ncbi:transposase [Domibacillus aminovorans]|uniref:Transposase n=1 Tax=Domibacillus aminovorans TaxID=29332 RepID=A0A177KZ52_9BACI|nr:RNA-guided endonuclease TnpB family protein [Domibacillus aminovorans]OAH58623.1 transposase [Domibacillus aminovorans]
MAQTITVKIKLIPTKEQSAILQEMSQEYISIINDLVFEMVKEKKSTKKASKNILAHLPSAVINQAIIDAKSVFRKAKKSKYTFVPVLKKPMCIWNNQNYSFDFKYISMPIMINGKAKKTPIRALLIDKDNRNFDLLKHKLGTLRITQKSGKWMAQISVTIPTVEGTGLKVMGVDLGLKIPAVAVTDDEKVRFFGNGRKNKYKKRKFRSDRKALGKKRNAIRKSKEKEQRWMEDQDHKISRAIINFAKENKISVIRLEQLANIRQTTRTSRKNEKNLHTWSFYRLSQFIEYKANLEGIRVEYVNPAYTSQTCPKCSKKNKAQDRKYKCKCGFEKHRDLVGAMNIRYAPVINGKS